MANLFDYGKKELTQDAFLMWILVNYNCNDDLELKHASRKLIEKLADIPESEEIIDISLKPQLYKIDIVAVITTKNDKYYLFVEDKVNSCEHNQLNRYNQNIKQHEKEAIIKKVFYKTHNINNDEQERIINADWKEISFKEINDFWYKFKDAKNIILSQYAKHVNKLWEDSNNGNKPENNDSIPAWNSYFEKKIIPEIKDICNVSNREFRGLYAYLRIEPFRPGEPNKETLMPYLEIRSRDCTNNNFRATILMYGVEKDSNNNPKGLNEIRDIIRSHEYKNIFKGDYGEKHNKQVAHTFKDNKHFKVKTDEEFINLCKEVINEYLEIVSFWKE